MDFYYHPGSGPCRSVLLTAKLLGIELNLKYLDLMKKEQLAPAFVKINPQHTVPTLVDNGFALWESYAIMTYLVRKYGKNDSLYPKDPKKQAMVDQRLYFDIGTLGARFGAYYYPIFMGNGTPDPEKYKKMEEAFQFLDVFLEGQEFAAGDTLTVADLALVATVTTYDVAKFDLSPYKNVARWYAKVQEVVPGFQEISGKETVEKIFQQFLKK